MRHVIYRSQKMGITTDFLTEVKQDVRIQKWVTGCKRKKKPALTSVSSENVSQKSSEKAEELFACISRLPEV